MQKLIDICEYRNSKIDVDELTLKNYISTENMIPNKGGIVEASGFPTVNKVQAYYVDDVLISNIRPYFKKIWLAKNKGGCSNDVLVLTAKQGVDSNFLYYILSDDKFFEYSTASSKGTKMPRGDKSAIMQYEVPKFNIEDQKKIGHVLRNIDAKIEVNNRINRNLVKQTKDIYIDWFVEYGHFGGEKPCDWRLGVLGDLASIKTTTFKPQKNPNIIVEHYSIPALDENHFPVFELAGGIKSNKYLLTKESMIISKLNPNIKRIWRPFCLSENPICSTEFIVFEALKFNNKDFIYSILDSDSFSNYLCANVTGSTGSRQRAIPKATLRFEVQIPPQRVIDEFCAIVTPIYNLIEKNEIENQRLKNIRNILLPKLISGELGVSDLDI